MIELKKYTDKNKEETITRIAQFFGFHNGLLNKDVKLNESNYVEAEKTLYMWLAPEHELYMILNESVVVGFIHLGYRGSNVAWIEDVYIDESYRKKGIATRAIQKAEEIIKYNSNYTAVCIDVVPRNE